MQGRLMQGVEVPEEVMVVGVQEGSKLQIGSDGTWTLLLKTVSLIILPCIILNCIAHYNKDGSI